MNNNTDITSLVKNLSSYYCQFLETDFKKGREPKANRKLLLNKREIIKLKQSISQKGLTAVPLEVYFNEKGWAKIVVATAKGKRLYDKKEALKERDIRRDMDRELAKHK